MVRPEKRTSSTRTTVFASIPTCRDGGGFGRPVGAAAQIVAVHRDVEAAGEFFRCLRPTGDRGDRLGESVGERDSATRDA
jgi:hypothetical protein